MTFVSMLLANQGQKEKNKKEDTTNEKKLETWNMNIPDKGQYILQMITQKSQITTYPFISDRLLMDCVTVCSLAFRIYIHRFL